MIMFSQEMFLLMCLLFVMLFFLLVFLPRIAFPSVWPRIKIRSKFLLNVYVLWSEVIFWNYWIFLLTVDDYILSIGLLLFFCRITLRLFLASVNLLKAFISLNLIFIFVIDGKFFLLSAWVIYRGRLRKLLLEVLYFVNGQDFRLIFNIFQSKRVEILELSASINQKIVIHIAINLLKRSCHKLANLGTWRYDKFMARTIGLDPLHENGDCLQGSAL